MSEHHDDPFHDQNTRHGAGRRQLGKYELIRLLGRGGMGEVWLALDTVAHVEVALKMLPPELRYNNEAQEQIRVSYQRVYRLAHSNICGVRDLVLDPGAGFFLVMDFFDGMTLSKYRTRHITQHGSFPAAEVARLLIPVAEALDHAHQQGIAHRDIKPSNILASDDGRRVRVIDFQLAAEIRATASRLTNLAVDTVGTYPYMAPEQLRGKRANAASDQYSLAMTAYELLAGEFPYEVAGMELWKSIVTDPETEIPEIPGVERHVLAALQRSLSLDPLQRMSSCLEFILALTGQSAANLAVPRETSSPIAPAASNTLSQQMTASPVPPLLTTETFATLVVNDHGNITRNLNDWLTEEICRDHALSIECLDLIGNRRFRFVPFDSGPAYGMKLAQDTDRVGWNSLTATANDQNRVTLRVRFQTVPELPVNQPFPATETPVQRLKRIKAEVTTMTAQVQAFLESYDYETAVRIFNQFSIEHLNFRDNELFQETIRKRDRVWELSHAIRQRLLNGNFHDPALHALAKQYLSLIPDDLGIQELMAELPKLPELPKDPKPGEIFRLRIVTPTPKHQPGQVLAVKIPVTVPERTPGEIQTLIIPSTVVAYKPGELLSIKIPIRNNSLIWSNSMDTEMKFAWIPPGRFDMGPHENIVCRVNISKGFWMGVTPVTQAQFRAVMGYNPSHHYGQQFKDSERYPVEMVSWQDSQEFCSVMSKMTGNKIRLPTEAEWEYACRAGTSTEYWNGNGEESLKKIAWYEQNSTHPQPVATFPGESHPWGLHDVLGNVWEWCSDWYAEYSSTDKTDPQGPGTQRWRVTRGGSYCEQFGNFDSRCRGANEPAARCDDLGFRVCFEPSK
jgi:formylglycine-generating enzyme required for sulfatase activity/serine/threonine protein kinase